MRLRSDLAFLFAPSFRARAYAQAMLAAGAFPGEVIALDGREPHWDGKRSVRASYAGFRFDPGQPVRQTIAAAGADIIEAGTGELNSAPVVKAVEALDAQTIIFAGPAGGLVGKELLSTGKRFLHIHGGVAPHYKGSTAFYFSLLKEGTIGATALFLNAGIDEGPILKTRFEVPDPDLEIDRLQDPILRACLLTDVLQESELRGERQTEAGTTYQVIHPVLKHAAMLKAGIVRRA